MVNLVAGGEFKINKICISCRGDLQSSKALDADRPYEYILYIIKEGIKSTSSQKKTPAQRESCFHLYYLTAVRTTG